MNGLLKFSSLIDRVNTRIGQGAAWLMLIAVVISAGNAMIRYSFNISSNAWLEIQWYLFGAMVMLGAAYSQRCACIRPCLAEPHRPCQRRERFHPRQTPGSGTCYW